MTEQNSTNTLAQIPGALTDQLPGWQFKPSKPEGGMTYNEFEGYYPDKGGKLSSATITLPKPPGQAAYYRIRFEAEAAERAYQGVDFFDSQNNPLADNYDVIYPGEKRAYERVVYATDKTDCIRVFFQSKTGMRAWNLSVEAVGPEEAAEYCDRLYATLPPLNFTAPANAMDLLPRTAEALQTGKPWRVVMLGDSIVQDTFHSQFHALLKRRFPNSNLSFDISVRGSTGCWHYCQADQFKKYVLDEKPDLLIIGGISNFREPYHPNGTEAMEIVARAARAHLGCEVLLLSAALAVDTRMFDPENPEAPLPAQPWNIALDRHVTNGFNPEEQTEMALRNELPLWDLATPTYTWLYASGVPHEWYSRDFVHSGERGKQVIGRALFQYFASLQS
jgi:hypothetical protein